jgi:hypothetical protein
MFACIMIPVLVLTIIGVLWFEKQKKRKKNKMRKKDSGLDIFLLKVYMKLDNFFLTEDTLRKITKQVQSMSCYSPRDSYILAAKYMLMAMGIAAAFIIAAVLMFDDMVSVALCSSFGLVFASVMVDKQVDKINIKVYNQLRGAISSIREEYLRTNSVPEAIENAEYGKELKPSFDSIYNILTQSNAEAKLKEFFERTPFRHIQTLARVCYDINNSGDEIDAYGNSNFLTAMNNMSTDINNELSRMKYQKMRFGKLEYLALIPVVGIKIIEKFFVGIMPGTAVIYQGSTGYLIRIGTLALSIVVYTIIAKINTTQSIKEDDRIYAFCALIKNSKFIRHFVYDWCPKNDKKNSRMKVQNKLNKALSKKGVEEFYLEKVVYGIAIFFISIFAMLCAIQMGKQHMLGSTQSLSLVDMELSIKVDKQTMLDMDNEYIKMRESGKEFKNDEAYNFVQKYMPGLSDMETQDQQKRLESKYNTIAKAYFHWWMIIICFILAVIGYNLPNMLLKLRRWLVVNEAEDDFLQLQTLMSIIMNTDGDTLDALEQMSEMSKIHQEMLLYCYHSYPSNPDKELWILEQKTPIMEFKRFIGKMRLSVSDLSLKEVFADLMLERDYIQEQRDIKMRQAIDKKRTLCGMLSKAPMGIMVVGEFLFPIGYLGATELMSAINSMQSM